MEYLWKKNSHSSENMSEKSQELHPVVARLLSNRGLTTQLEIDEFLSPDYSRDVHDPFLFRDMDKACRRIWKAIKSGEKITIYGDYDADGVSASVILQNVLKKFTSELAAYIPHREKEGYGLNRAAVEEISNDGTKVLISCDCGISNTAEVGRANELGIDVIITDHHSIPAELPPALAIIHAQLKDEVYPFKYLAGGGVAFKLAQAVLRHELNDQMADRQKEVEEKWLLDLVAISTVADMVPLLGENRTLLKYGLIVLKKAMRPGLAAMLSTANLSKDKIDARSIAFMLAPRINAAGRMDHANLAYYLLIEPDSDKAMELAGQLNVANQNRQKLTEETVLSAKGQPIDLRDKILFFYDEKWSAGLNGLVASRLVREYNRPCFVLTKNDEQIIGSGRSIPGFDITESLTKNAKLLTRFGGHPQACGFACAPQNMLKLTEEIKKIGQEQITEQDLQPVLEYELDVDFEDINWDLADMLKKFEPFGQSNPEPLLQSKNVKVLSAKRIGNTQTHWKLVFEKGPKKIGAVAFGLAHKNINIGENLDIVYNLTINQWNGNREIQLIIRDFKLHV